jgi:hypothetical protein
MAAREIIEATVDRSTQVLHMTLDDGDSVSIALGALVSFLEPAMLAEEAGLDEQEQEAA